MTTMAICGDGDGTPFTAPPSASPSQTQHNVHIVNKMLCRWISFIHWCLWCRVSWWCDIILLLIGSMFRKWLRTGVYFQPADIKYDRKNRKDSLHVNPRVFDKPMRAKARGEVTTLFVCTYKFCRAHWNELVDAPRACFLYSFLLAYWRPSARSSCWVWEPSQGVISTKSYFQNIVFIWCALDLIFYVTFTKFIGNINGKCSTMQLL